MKNVIASEASSMLRKYKGEHFFTVKFVKRTTGEVRVMNCRKGVSKYTKGGSLAYSPEERNLLVVWDAQVKDPSKGYRMINLDSVLEFKIDGEEFRVVPG